MHRFTANVEQPCIQFNYPPFHFKRIGYRPSILFKQTKQQNTSIIKLPDCIQRDILKLRYPCKVLLNKPAFKFLKGFTVIAQPFTDLYNFTSVVKNHRGSILLTLNYPRLTQQKNCFIFENFFLSLFFLSRFVQLF